jgi:rRNA-processing protein FCF1
MAADRRGNSEGLASSLASVILDTNFLFVPLRFGVDIFEELERVLGRHIRCIVPRPVIRELNLLKRDSNPSFQKEIDFALELVRRCHVTDGDRVLAGGVDDHIMRLAIQTGYPVATNDKEFRRRLRAEGVPVIFLRQRTHLELVGRIK